MGQSLSHSAPPARPRQESALRRRSPPAERQAAESGEHHPVKERVAEKSALQVSGEAKAGPPGPTGLPPDQAQRHSAYPFGGPSFSSAYRDTQFDIIFYN